MNIFTETNQSETGAGSGAPAGCRTPFTCPLNLVRAGMRVRIKELSAPPEVTKRLREIGFGEEQVIRLLVHQTDLICQVCNARLALSSQLARLILVEPLPACAGYRN